MTDLEMNVSAMKKMSRRLAGLVAAASGLALGGCVGAFDPGMDQTSPLAPRVAALVAAHREYPRWEDFPTTTPAPEPVQVAARVNTLRATGGALAGEVSRIEWSVGDVTDFQREVAARVDATEVSPAAIATTAEIEARASALRDRAKAPPPIGRRQ